ncbi:MAG: phosphotyrosine protein phosphatase [Candidatus Obscuribacterales bacterium]|nr:phosphotyrosine protein phosphatase [Candidatus Obscuribacterales bacterium]
MQVIFACIHNAGRSQIASALFNKLATEGASKMRALSAGTDPAQSVHEIVVEVMREEEDIDLSAIKPKLLTRELASQAKVLVTMGCGERCPFVAGLEIVDWQIPDPKGQPKERVKEIKKIIESQVSALYSRLELLEAKEGTKNS